jgi:hypothetical protein
MRGQPASSRARHPGRTGPSRGSTAGSGEDALPIVHARHPHTHPQLRLVNIDPRAALDDELHRHYSLPSLDDAEAPRRGAWSSRVYSACSWHRSGYRSSRVTLRGTAKGHSRPDDRHRGAHRILRHAAPAHFHRSRVGETHEVLRRSFSSLRRMVLQRVKRGIEAKDQTHAELRRDDFTRTPGTPPTIWPR